MKLYCCYERYVYGGLNLYCFADSDQEAIDKFMKEVETWKGEFYVGRVEKQIDDKEVQNRLPSTEIKIFAVHAKGDEK